MKWPFKWLKKYVIGRENEPYLTRWDLLGTRHNAKGWPHLFLHCFHRSDSDAALHDHPWWFLSLILRSGYYEYTENDKIWYPAGSLLFRHAEWAHRIVLKEGTEGKVWTVVFAGGRSRLWGFLCPKEWTPWMKVTEREDAGLPGCE